MPRREDSIWVAKLLWILKKKVMCPHNTLEEKARKTAKGGQTEFIETGSQKGVKKSVVD